MNRSEKETLVSTLRTAIEGSNLVVVTRQSGLTVAEVTALRHKMREAGADYKVVKNTLARLVVKGTKYEGLSHLLRGPTALAFSIDPVVAAKVAAEFADKSEKLEVVGGGLGDKVLDGSAIQALAKLPSLDTLRSQLVGLLQAPATKIARVAKEPAGQIARVVAAYGRSQ